MGFFDQMKMAQEMMKNMTPDQIRDLMEQAKVQKQAMEETVRKLVAEEIQKRGLVTRTDVETMIQKVQ